MDRPHQAQIIGFSSGDSVKLRFHYLGVFPANEGKPAFEAADQLGSQGRSLQLPFGIGLDVCREVMLFMMAVGGGPAYAPLFQNPDSVRPGCSRPAGPFFVLTSPDPHESAPSRSLWTGLFNWFLAQPEAPGPSALGSAGGDQEDLSR
jgi:hypothetical protein